MNNFWEFFTTNVYQQHHRYQLSLLGSITCILYNHRPPHLARTVAVDMGVVEIENHRTFEIFDENFLGVPTNIVVTISLPGLATRILYSHRTSHLARTVDMGVMEIENHRTFKIFEASSNQSTVTLLQHRLLFDHRNSKHHFAEF